MMKRMLLAFAGVLVVLVLVLPALTVIAPSSRMAAAPSTSLAAAAAPAVHATGEADLALLREARPTWTGVPIAGLRMRWCVAQDRCRDGSR